MLITNFFLMRKPKNKDRGGKGDRESWSKRLGEEGRKGQKRWHALGQLN